MHECTRSCDVATTVTPENYPSVSIIIPVYNGTQTIRLCLDAVTDLDYPKDKYEVIVVDNNSTDGTPDIVTQYEEVRLVYERDLQGPHAATNTGVRQASGDVVAFTDSDCVPERGWLQALVAPFDEDDVVAVGGRIEVYEPASRVERFLQREEDAMPLKNCLKMSDSFPVSIITANAAYRMDALHDVGLFNAQMYTGSEVDLAWRVQWKTGKRVVYAPHAVIYHKFSSSIRKLSRHFRIYGYSEIMLGTLHKEAGYPRSPAVQLKVMASQTWSLLNYLASFVYRAMVAPIRKYTSDHVLSPLIWLVVEAASLCGKLEALWLTRFYRRRFWEHRARTI